MFKPFTLEDVKEYAVKMGYEVEDIEIQEDGGEYEVSFGHEYTEVWVWTFDDLEDVATDYEHAVWDD
jgi:hypothetical protein